MINDELTLDIKTPKISFKSSVTVPPPKPPKIPTPQNNSEHEDSDTIESDQDTKIKYDTTSNMDPEYERTFKSGREYDLRDDPDAIVCPTCGSLLKDRNTFSSH